VSRGESRAGPVPSFLHETVSNEAQHIRAAKERELAMARMEEEMIDEKAAPRTLACPEFTLS
jgi:hypothetical protein